MLSSHSDSERKRPPGAFAIVELGDAKIKIEALDAEGRMGNARILLYDNTGDWEDLGIAISRSEGTRELASPILTVAVNKRNARWDLYAGGLKIAKNLSWKHDKKLTLSLSSGSDSITAFVERVLVGTGEVVPRQPNSSARGSVRGPKPEVLELLKKKGIIVGSNILEEFEAEEREGNDD